MDAHLIEIENRKYLGPTVKLLALAGGDWAILDHNFQFVAVVPANTLPPQVRLCRHSERPRPQRLSDNGLNFDSLEIDL